MGGGSRGVKKPKLRDLSVERLTPQEQDALIDAIGATSTPIAKAILGAVLVEHELEVSLRRRIGIKDDAVWKDMLDERGPFSTFSRKIITGRAYRIYDDNFTTNLDIVRSIRNAFAHSKRLIDFDNPLVGAEIGKIKPIPGRRKSFASMKKAKPEHAYVSLCMNLATSLIKRRIRSMASANKKRPKTSPFYRALAPALGLGVLGEAPWPPQSNSKLNPLLFPQNQTGGPKPVAPQGLWGGLMALNQGKSEK